MTPLLHGLRLIGCREGGRVALSGFGHLLFDLFLLPLIFSFWLEERWVVPDRALCLA